MNAIIIFLIKSVICSALFCTYYFVMLRNTKLHRYNRGYLLLSIPASLLIPLLNFRFYSLEIFPPSQMAINTAQFAEMDTVFSWQNLLIPGAAAVALVLLIRVATRIYHIMSLAKMHVHQPMEGFYLLQSDLGCAPFSFFNKLFWKKTISVNDPVGQKIFLHELAHIRQYHSYDKLFVQTVCCILWMNPFYWIIQRELLVVHEYLADAACIEEGDTNSFAQMLLRSVNNGQYLAASHPFFNSSVQRRLIMIASSSKTSFSLHRKCFVIPIIISLSIAVSFTGLQKIENIPQLSLNNQAPVLQKPVPTELKPVAPSNQKSTAPFPVSSKPATKKKEWREEDPHSNFLVKNSSPPAGGKDAVTIDGLKKDHTETYNSKPRAHSEATKETKAQKNVEESKYP